MTEESSELNLCPNCGKENLPMATRCVHCGAEMESLFTFYGQKDFPEDEAEETPPVTEIIEEMRSDPALQAPGNPEPEAQQPPEEAAEAASLPSEPLPDWLAKVRERAQEDEDAVGDLVSGTMAMDAARSEDGAASVEGEFNAWIIRIREKSQQESSARARQIPNEPEEPDQAPEWLRRIRALRPQPEEEQTQEVQATPAFLDDLPREWTDEALAELRRQALAEERDEETEPLASEEEQMSGPSVEEPQETPAEEPERLEDFHNIPEEEEVTPQALVDENLTPTAEEEYPVDATQQAEPPHEESLPEEMPADAENVEAEPEEVPENEADGAESAQPAAEPEEEPAGSELPPASDAVPPDLLLLRDQQNRASLLASLIEEEGRVTAGKQAAPKPVSKIGHLAVALLLLVGLIVSVLIGPAALPADAPRSLPMAALQERVQNLAEGDKVLVLLDYHAAASRELEALAAPILADLHARGISLTFLTSQPSGLYLAPELLAQAGLPESTPVDFLPGSYLNMISWATNPAISSTGDSLVRGKNIAFFKMAILVSDSSESIRGWLEQIAPWVQSLEFAAVSTQMEAPVLLPYFDSGQLVGYAAGIADGSLGAQAAFSYRAYRVGLLLMLVMLLLGMISKAEADAIRREEERLE
ncbi:MAG: hypothetical protein WBJ23_03325 [Anaerolineaceae bacterium]|nr:hypothetical protein [Chloroflexota bacterium]